jgi:hypothetical protein
MELRPFYKCIPDPTLIVGDAGKGLDHIVTMRASDGSYVMIYLPTGKPVIVDIYKLSGEKFNSWWFDPRDGSVKLGGNFDRNTAQEFKPPMSKHGNDWILVLDDVERNYRLPSS